MNLDDMARETAKFYALKACREETRQDILAALRDARDQGRREGLEEAQEVYGRLEEPPDSALSLTPYYQGYMAAAQQYRDAIARLLDPDPEDKETP